MRRVSRRGVLVSPVVLVDGVKCGVGSSALLRVAGLFDDDDDDDGGEVEMLVVHALGQMSVGCTGVVIVVSFIVMSSPLDEVNALLVSPLGSSKPANSSAEEDWLAVGCCICDGEML